jgi:hypothetical protein
MPSKANRALPIWKSTYRAVAILLTATSTHAQDSQFLFDANGNLLVQSASINAPPQITRQPQNRTVGPGETASFFVVAADTRALSYQWRFNSTDIGGATGDALLLQNVSTNNEGEFRVVVTNPSGSVTSAPAFLMIDSDGDNMGDSWELTYFGHLDQNAARDADHDGSSNLEEFRNGTDPTDGNSYAFRLVVIRDIGTVVKTPDQIAYTNGQSVTLTAIPPTNGAFHAWLGDIVTRSNPVTLVMTNDKTVYARFTPIIFTWTSPASGDWETAANWTPRLAPNSNDTAVIVNNNVTVTLNTSAVCADVTLGSAASNPTLTGSGTLTVRGKLAWASGTMSGSGRTVLEPGASFTLDSASQLFLDTRTLELGGQASWTTPAPLALKNAVITNRPGALLDIQHSPSVIMLSAASRIDNAGTVRKSIHAGTTTFGSGVSFNNYGTVEIETGTLDFAGGGTHTASSSMTGAGHLTFSGGTANLAGLVNVSGSNTFTSVNLLVPGTMNFTGTYICTNNTLTIAGNNTVNFSGLGLLSPAVLELKELGVLTGTSTVTVLNSMNWTAGTMSGSGRTIIPPGAILNAAPPGGVDLAGRTLENGGTLLWTGAGFFSVRSGGVITNRPGALFHVQNAAGIGGGAANGRFDNAGVFRKSVNAGTTAFANGLSFNNFASVEIQTGTLSLGGGGAHSGSFAIAANAALNLSGGTHNANGSSSLTGAGQLTVSGGTANLAGLVNVSGSHTFINLGTANFTGNTICTNNTLTVSNGGTANFSATGLVSPAVVNLNNGTLDGTSTVTVNTAMNWTAGTMSGSGRTIIPMGATLNIAVPSGNLALLNTRTLENGGTVLWTGAGSIAMNLGGVLTNRAGALFDVQNAATIVANAGVGRIDNAGTFRKSANAGTTTIGSGISFNNSGAVEIQTGTLSLGGGGAHSGSFDVPGGTALILAGGTHTANASSSLTGAGQLTVSGGAANLAGLVNVSGNHTFLNGGTANFTGNTICTNNTLTFSNGGVANFSGTGLVSPAVVNLNNGTLDGTSTVTVNAAMNWTAGTMSGSGRTIIPMGATLTIANPSGVGAGLNTRTLENGGTVLWTGTGSIAMNLGAVITNRAGALFHVQNAASFVANAGVGRIDNAGTLRKSGNTGTTTIGAGVSFNNSGTVDIRSGILAANGAYVSSSNARLNCALGGTTAGVNYGQLQVAGTVTLNGGLSVDLLSGFTPATNDVFTVVTAGSRNSTFASFSYPANRVTLSLSNSPTSVILRATEVFPVPQPVLLNPQFVGSNVLLTWTATSNVTYRLENNAMGSTNWIAVPGDITTLSNSATKLDALTPSNRFYRVRVLP